MAPDLMSIKHCLIPDLENSIKNVKYSDMKRMLARDVSFRVERPDFCCCCRCLAVFNDEGVFVLFDETKKMVNKFCCCGRLRLGAES